MKNASRPILQPLVLTALLIISLLLSPLLHAQAATGTLTGRIYNAAQKQYVNNAQVTLDGTNRETYTTSDGRFEFDGVPLGTVSITVNYTGYNSIKKTVAVAAGNNAVEQIDLLTASGAASESPDSIQLAALSVNATKEGNAKAIQDQRKNMNIVTSTSVDLFGDINGGNAGEFLKYLPGVDLDYVDSEVRGPRLGGMDGQYVGVAIDGMRTASADANRGLGSGGRATSFEGFSVTNIESIEINRTASPENDGDTPAGNINLKTKRAFDREGRLIEYNVGTLFDSEQFTLTQKRHPLEHDQYQFAPNWNLGYAESFLDHRLGVYLNTSRSSYVTEQTAETNTYNRNPTATDPRQLVVQQIDVRDAPKWIQRSATSLTADFKATPHFILSLNLIYSRYTGDYDSRSFTFQNSTNDANVNTGRSTIGGDGLNTIVANNTGSGQNTAPQISWGTGGADKKTFTRQYAPSFQYKIGSLTVDGSFGYSQSVNIYSDLGAGMASQEFGAIPSSFIATRPNDRSWEWDIRQTGGPDWSNILNFSSTNSQNGGTSVQDRTENWKTTKWTGILNASYPLSFLKLFPTLLKVGGKWDEENRRNHNYNNWAQWAYVGPGGDTVTYNPNTQTYAITGWGNWANVGPQFVSQQPFTTNSSNMLTVENVNGTVGFPPRPSRNAIADLYHAHPELFVPTGNVNDYYNAYYANENDYRQTISAGYIQADTKILHNLTIRYGVRMEETQSRNKAFNPLTPTQMIDSPYASQFVQTVDANGHSLVQSTAGNSRATSISGIDYQYSSQPKITQTSHYDNFFPSVIVKYNILPNLEWQAGWNKAIARPALSNLVGLYSYNENASPPTVTVPNPNLTPEHHTDVQTRLTYYFGNRSPGQLSVAVLQDEVKNFIQSFTYDSGAPLGLTDPTFNGYQFTSFANDPLVVHRYRNFDFHYQQTLGFLPGYLSGTTLDLAYSRSYDNQYHNNLLPREFKGQFSYVYKGFSTGLGLIWQDKSPRNNNPYRWLGAMTKMDWRAGYRLSSHLEFYVNVRNITNVKDEFYESTNGVYGQQGKLQNIEQFGANWNFGIKGTF